VFGAAIHGESEANTTGINLFFRPDSFAHMYLAVNPFNESFRRCKVAMAISNKTRDVSCTKSLHLLNAFSDLVGMGVIRENYEETLTPILDLLIQYK
jgi:hypothetical protein